jgi:hypothetical protein
MRNAVTFLVAGFALSSAAFADVRELEGEELVEAFVQGISIGQPVVGEDFDSDDQKLRETAADQRSALGTVEPELAVSNVESLNRAPTVDQLVANIQQQETRDLVEDTIMQTSLSTRMDVNLDRVSAETGITAPTSDNRDFSVLRGSVLELLPSATGYQFEFLQGR